MDIPVRSDDVAAAEVLLDEVPAVLWATDLDLRFTASRGAALRELGLAPDEVVGRSLQEYFGSDDPDFPAIAAHLQALEGVSTAYEQNWQGRRFETRVRPLRDGTGAIVGTLGVAIDVTDRMWERGALFDTESKYQALVEAIPAVTYIDPLDEWGDTLYVSPQLVDLLGCPPEAWLTDPSFWRKHLHPDDAEAAWRAWERARDRGESYEQEYRMVHEDGHAVWVSDRAVVLRDPAGRPWLVQGVLFDVTERKLAERDLSRALEREREITDHLRRVDELRTLQLHAVSHDLRAPITAILGSALVLDDDHRELDREKRSDLLRGVVASARKLHRLVNDLLDLDRLERGMVEPDRRPTDVGAVVRHVVDELRDDAHPVRLDLEPGAAEVDPVHIERIVENLVANTLRHTPAGTPVAISVRYPDHDVEIRVEDEGPGVPEELRDEIFEPFRHGGRGQGLGIGLSLVARFAALHGGVATVGDREGRGAVFTVRLPPPAPAAS
jgi:PAS domain S-box-containing protein